MKMSILVLHDKLSTLTFRLNTFMKKMKGIVIEDVFVEEEVEEGEAAEKKEEVTKDEFEHLVEGKEEEKEEEEEKRE